MFAFIAIDCFSLESEPGIRRKIQLPIPPAFNNKQLLVANTEHSGKSKRVKTTQEGVCISKTISTIASDVSVEPGMKDSHCRNLLLANTETTNFSISSASVSLAEHGVNHVSSTLIANECVRPTAFSATLQGKPSPTGKLRSPHVDNGNNSRLVNVKTEDGSQTFVDKIADGLSA
jgi:hypothetical protein